MNYLVLLASQANLLGIIRDVSTMLTVDALDERFLVIAWLSLVVEHEVETSLVESHRVGAGKDAHVLELRVGRMTVAIAVHTHVVHHVDVDDVLAMVEVLMHALCRSCHALQKIILLRQVCPKLGGILYLSCCMDVSLAIGRGYADALVLEHSTRVPFTSSTRLRIKVGFR